MILQTQGSCRCPVLTQTHPTGDLCFQQAADMAREAGQGCVTGSSAETVTLRGSEQAQIQLLPHLCLEYTHGLLPSPWDRLCLSLPCHEGSRFKVSFPWLQPVTQSWGNVL